MKRDDTQAGRARDLRRWWTNLGLLLVTGGCGAGGPLGQASDAGAVDRRDAAAAGGSTETEDGGPRFSDAGPATAVDSGPSDAGQVRHDGEALDARPNDFAGDARGDGVAIDVRVDAVGEVSGDARRGAFRIWIAGDSTVATGGPACPWGWGGALAKHLRAEVTVNNRAVAGRSVRTWLYDVQDTQDSTGECAVSLDSAGEPVLQSRWQETLDGMREADVLLIQFGINDGSTACPRHVGLPAFQAALGMMAEQARLRGATAIFLTPTSAIACRGTQAQPTRGAFVDATRQAGVQFGIPVIDLHALTIAYYQEHGFCPIPGGDIGPSTGGDVGAFFCDDHTHFDRGGADAIAGLVAQALAALPLGIAPYVTDP